MKKIKMKGSLLRQRNCAEKIFNLLNILNENA